MAIDEELGLVYLPVETPIVRLLRRASAGQQPVRRQPGGRRSEDRQAQVALPAGAPSALEHGHLHGADPRRHHRRRQSHQGGVGHGQAGDGLRLRSRDRRSRCGRSRSGRCRRATCRARSTRRRSRFRAKPPPYDHQGVTEDNLIDFTPELRAEALKLMSRYKMGPIFTPPVLSKAEGPIASFRSSGGTNWPGGAFDPETQILYVPSYTSLVPVGLMPPPEQEVLGHSLRARQRPDRRALHHRARRECRRRCAAGREPRRPRARAAKAAAARRRRLRRDCRI